MRECECAFVFGRKLKAEGYDYDSSESMFVSILYEVNEIICEQRRARSKRMRWKKTESDDCYMYSAIKSIVSVFVSVYCFHIFHANDFK